MNGLNIFKKVVGFTVGAGISKIVSGVVEHNVTKDKALDKVAVVFGEYALTMVIQDMVQERVDAKIDGYVAKFHEIMKAKDEGGTVRFGDDDEVVVEVNPPKIEDEAETVDPVDPNFKDA